MASETISQERLDKAFTHLTTRKTLITNCIDQWTKTTTHFKTLDESITQQSKSLDTKLLTLDTHLQESLHSLDDREKSLPLQEPLLIARVNDLKETALTECEKDGKKKGWIDEAVRGYFRKMDAVGLLQFIAEKRKEGEKLKGFIPEAVKEAVDQERFVLDCVKEYIIRRETRTGFAENRQALSVMFLEVFPIKERRLPVAKSIREEAGSVAEKWKAMMEKEQGDSTSGNVDALIFLSFVLGFGVFERFDKGLFRKLIVERPIPKFVPMVSALGFGVDEIGDIIEDLLKRDKEIDAINFACEYGLTERFEPAELLKAYLTKARARAQKVMKDGNLTPSASKHGDHIELISLRAVIKCVEEHKLGEVFYLEGIKERAAVLEKSKPDRREGFSKRTRGGADSSYPSYPAKYGRGSGSYSYDRRNPGPAYQSPAAAYAGSYRHHPSEAAYRGPPSGTYSSHYGSHARIPAAFPPSESLGAAGAPTSYGAYDYSGVAPSSY